jgi:hypothetical protein
MATVIVAGAIANKCHNGGEAWVRLSWVLGFRKLGCRVYLVEQIAPDACVDGSGARVPFEESKNLAYFREVTEEFGLSGAASLLYGDGGGGYGISLEELLDVTGAADLLVNISGHLTLEPLLRRARRTAFVDIDPGFTQCWHAAGLAGGRIPEHDFYFTIGENIGTDGCRIPTAGLPWRPTRQPVVLEDWPVHSSGFDRFTTIANWRGPYGPLEYGGETFGVKVHQFRRFIELPRSVSLPFELALNIHPADAGDLRALHENGWRTVDPQGASRDPAAFRCYVQGSGAEFSVAQGVYVETCSGWFSDRTARYLASGRPVLVQETGFSRNLPVGEGLLSFQTLEEATAGAERIARDYPAHCRAARAVAEEYFDSDRILGEMLETIRVA